jgi:2-polyprenyl-3-methyl-5-hydroxy-6-metoxy-1,4-benzoquinol methylase
VERGARIFDAGCGGGRNLTYLLRHAAEAGYEIRGVDENAHAINLVRRMAASIAPGTSPNNFRAESLESMSFPDGWADFVISSAVLHFAESDEHFAAMLSASWRVLRPGGVFFCRLASSIGIETQISPIAGRRHLLPDGSERYLVDVPYLLQLAEQLGGDLIDPLKTTVVQNQRSMTTWVMQKRRG